MVDPKEALKRNGHQPPTRHRIGKDGPPDKDKAIAYSYAAYGATDEDIAAVLGMDNKTLVKHFKEELRSGRATAKNTIAQRLYNIAVGKDEIRDPETKEIIVKEVKPNLSALIFLAKTRLGWRETQVIEQTVDMKSGVQIYLPDNGMRCEDE